MLYGSMFHEIPQTKSLRFLLHNLKNAQMVKPSAYFPTSVIPFFETKQEKQQQKFQQFSPRVLVCTQQPKFFCF